MECKDLCLQMLVEHFIVLLSNVYSLAYEA